MMIPSTKKDERWQGLNIFSVTAFLFGIALVNLALSICDFVFRKEIFALVALCVSGVTLIHTFTDLLLMPRGKLDPIYVTIMSSILLSFWLGVFICGVLDLVSSIYFDGCYSYSYAFGIGHTSCGLMNARFAMSISIISLYLTSVVISAMALKRYQRLGLTRQQSKHAINIELRSDSKLGLV